MTEQTIAELFSELASAEDAFKTAQAEERRARNAACTCLNRVNKAQKAIDEMLASIKAVSSSDTDWRRTK